MSLFISFVCYGTGINHKVCKRLGVVVKCRLLFLSLVVFNKEVFLSPFLFAVYIDDLSRLLNNVRAGYYGGNSCINHIFC